MSPLTAGTRLGPYEIVAPLGAGGMGEVYRARDPRLDRDVAIKALPAAFAQDAERLARFEREAKVLATLNHPNLGAIYGLEEAAGQRYLVLELVEGETLAVRLTRGRLALEEALEICRQIAAALESAHENGIVHRDLKPGNVMISPAGLVKVLDFGLAKSGGSNPSVTGPVLTESPTMGYEPTGAGIILGTAAYMSPEQARGRAVDKRSDIWSFGCVLYECLAGRQCFEGETVSDLIARILQTEPEWEALPAKTPGRIRELLRRCLEKDARRRLRDIGDARIEIEDVQTQRASDSSTAVGATGAARPGRRQVRDALLVAIAALVAVVGTLIGGRLLVRPALVPPMRFEVADTPSMNLSSDGVNSAISPDGTTLVFVANDPGGPKLWVRPLAVLAARPLAGTEGGQMPFWSPDSRYIGFFTESQLKRVDAAGGQVDVLCDLKRARGGTWNRADQIVFAPGSDGGLDLIPAAGGDVRHVTRVDSMRHETGHRFPTFLPDGKHFLFSVLPPHAGRFEIDVGSIDSPKREKIMEASSGAVYAPPGRLLYLRGTTLVAQRFDPAQRRLSGNAMPLREPLSGTNFSGGPGFSVSTNGILAYATFKTPETRVAWANLQGHEIQRLGFGPASYNQVGLSPDGRRAVFTVWDASHMNSLWIGDLERGVATRFSQESESCENPRWSPDGTRIAYLTSLLGPQTIVVRSIDGSEPARTYLENDPAFKELCCWTPDGHALVFGRQDPVSRFDLWVLPLTGDSKPWVYAASPFNEQGASISPDGRWMSYSSDESGRGEIYVQSFPKPGPKYQVTTSGGLGAGWPKWGGELFYGEVATLGTITSAQVLPGPTFRLGPPHTYSKVPPDAVSFDLVDRKRLLAVLPAGKPLANSITVVVDWPAALAAK